jgi:paraquat-inducible protein A
MTPSSSSQLSPRGLTTCHECDLLHRLVPLAPGARAYCSRCGALMYRAAPGGVDRALALALTALGLFLIANLFPFLALNIEGRVEQNLVASGVLALWRNGMPELAVLVALTSIVFPLLMLSGLLWLLAPLKLGRRAPGSAAVVRVLNAIGPWTLLGVFLLGALIAFVKLQDLAAVIPGVSLYAFAGLMLAVTGAVTSFEVGLLWPRVGPAPAPGLVAGTTAHEHALVACHACTLLVRIARRSRDGAHAHCPRCASPLHGTRKRDSLTRTWALVLAAAILAIPANVYPVMTVIRFGQGEPSTIVSGVVHLVAEGMLGLALIVFFASVVVPGLKIALLVYLLLSVQRRSPWRPRDRTRLYRITEVVGAWSMVDIFLVGILAALVNLEALATITPEVGATFFAGVVVLTMFAAHSFDPRLIWDHAVVRS